MSQSRLGLETARLGLGKQGLTDITNYRTYITFPVSVNAIGLILFLRSQTLKSQ